MPWPNFPIPVLKDCFITAETDSGRGAEDSLTEKITLVSCWPAPSCTHLHYDICAIDIQTKV